MSGPEVPDGGRAALPSRFSQRDLIEEAEREAFLRRRVFPGQIARGRMTRAEADRRIDLMEAIARRLRETAHL